MNLCPSGRRHLTFKASVFLKYSLRSVLQLSILSFFFLYFFLCFLISMQNSKHPYGIFIHTQFCSIATLFHPHPGVPPPPKFAPSFPLFVPFTSSLPPSTFIHFGFHYHSHLLHLRPLLTPPMDSFPVSWSLSTSLPHKYT